jgi:hypothetical protein
MRTRWLFAALTTSLIAAACGGTIEDLTYADEGLDTGGGAAGGGQTSGTGGVVGTGGAKATGGSKATGAGGSTATGGKSGTGGATATGGSSGTGGAKPDAGACIVAKTPSGGGMNQGEACLSCHQTFQPPRLFTLGGTLYADANGTAAVGGATVTITDQNDVVTTLVSGSDGSFWSAAAFAFPVNIAISACPSTVSMPTTADSGDCNNCHVAGTRIHLP